MEAKDQQPCVRCGAGFPSWKGVVHSDGKGGSLGFFCGPCWTSFLSEDSGEELDHIEVAPIAMESAGGRKHEFHFRFSPAPRTLEAVELIDGEPRGYRFIVSAGVTRSGEEERPMPTIVEPLLEKMRRALARIHLEPSQLSPEQLTIKDRIVRGRIDWDVEEDGRVPMLTIDGKEITWDAFGRILTNFEGWQFRLEILDPSEEA